MVNNRKQLFRNVLMNSASIHLTFNIAELFQIVYSYRAIPYDEVIVTPTIRCIA